MLENPDGQEIDVGGRARPMRTTRACDRCRLKKSKCDGKSPCGTCTTNDLVCLYETIRSRDARTWQRERSEIMEEGLQRMYMMCRQAGVIPNQLPIDSNGRVSTESILQSLGLLRAGERMTSEAALPPAGRFGQNAAYLSFASPDQPTAMTPHHRRDSRTSYYPPRKHSGTTLAISDFGDSSTRGSSIAGLDMAGQFQAAMHEKSFSDVNVSNEPQERPVTDGYHEVFMQYASMSDPNSASHPQNIMQVANLWMAQDGAVDMEARDNVPDGVFQDSSRQQDLERSPWHSWHQDC